jgi:DNA modification methylase
VPLVLNLPTDDIKELHDFDDLTEQVETSDHKLYLHFQEKFLTKQSLSRAVVSFQHNKTQPKHRWYKFKEAFSASLVNQLLSSKRIQRGKVLDPFAGSGTTNFVSSFELGLDSDAIELLPIGLDLISARGLLEKQFTNEDFTSLKRWIKATPWKHTDPNISLSVLRITDGAYPPVTKLEIEKYLTELQKENRKVAAVLKFALLCILESISYTRKDGQCLRWDYRSDRNIGTNTFNKGTILSFDAAITNKLNDIYTDSIGLSALFATNNHFGNITTYPGSCLDILPTLSESSYEAIVTSPPYCNRYDYTRTYALELALLGVSEDEIRKLRQQMLSCTVENRSKDLKAMNTNWGKIINICDEEELLQDVLRFLDEQKKLKRLNNPGIARMVQGYFYEMACVIYECFRVLKPNGYMFMVNDNVRYAGVDISVDMILSSVAEKIGFEIENILLLPQTKGNSSQQMGNHGRSELRKCVYVWKKNSEWRKNHI